MHSEYSEDCDNLEYLDGELELKNKFNLDDSQIKWRRSKIAKIGLEKFKREFPTSAQEAYSVTGNVYIPEDITSNISVIPVEPIPMVYLSKPQAQDQYAIGVDVAAGVGRDYSVIIVISKTSYQTVAIYRSNRIVPTDLATKIIDLAVEYNNALVLVESNNYGNVVLNEMRHQGYTKIWKDSDNKDWQTTGKSKVEMFEMLKELIMKGYITAIDNITYAELRALQVDNTGRIIIPDTLSSHGDSAIAISLAYVCLNNVEIKKTLFLPDWIVSRKASKIISGSGVSVSSKKRY
jgi:hypothetical protein